MGMRKYQRAIARANMLRLGFAGLNKPSGGQGSTFSRMWRKYAPGGDQYAYAMDGLERPARKEQRLV